MNPIKNAFKEACRDFNRPKLLFFTFIPTAVLFVIAAILTYEMLGFANLERIPFWISQIEAGKFSFSMLPLVKVAILIPVLLVFALLSVSFFLLPLVNKGVEARCALDLEAKQGGSWLGSCWAGLVSTGCAIAILVALSPIWISSNFGGVAASILMGIPCARVFFYDGVARHASSEERRALMRLHKGDLRIMGAGFGLLSFFPGVFLTLALSTKTFKAIPIDMVLAVWCYALVYALTAAWFAHYGIDSLRKMRESTVNRSK